MHFNLTSFNSVANQFIAELRDQGIQKDRLRFRRNLERIGEILAYEISRTLEYHVVPTETPLGVADMSLPKRRIVLATVLRAGLPFHQGMLNFFDQADNSFIGAYRREHQNGKTGDTAGLCGLCRSERCSTDSGRSRCWLRVPP
jgi:uracil phosphoribosyltransferase